MDQGRRAIGLALLAALLFGVTTPAAKALLSVTDPWLLAGLLYIGSGIGLGAVRLMMMAVGRGSHREAPLRQSDLPVARPSAIVCGRGFGPVLLMLRARRMVPPRARPCFSILDAVVPPRCWRGGR